MKDKRKIAVVTGSRAEYGYLNPLMKKVDSHPKLELLLYVTGMHIVKEYGYTIQEIRSDKFRISKIINMNIKVKNTPFDMASSIGEGVLGFAKAFNEDKPHIVAVYGDRMEPLAAAIAAATLNIPVAHIGGGEVGFTDIDNTYRHAITKLAHLHFTLSKQSKERVLKLGEESWRVSCNGALSLDTILDQKLLPKRELCEKYNISNKPIILISYHPTTTEWKDAGKQMRLVMSAVTTVAKEEDMEIVVIYPNAYAGGYQIIKVIKEYCGRYKHIHVFKNLPHFNFASLMSASSVLVGNSSSGIIEAPSVGTPFVCIGTRQEGRERAKNVIDVGYDKIEIIKAIKKALHDTEFLSAVKKRESPYGGGKASDRIVKILSKIKIDKKLLQKRITY